MQHYNINSDSVLLQTSQITTPRIVSHNVVVLGNMTGVFPDEQKM